MTASSPTVPAEIDGDLLYGAEAIGRVLSMSARQVQHLHTTRQAPTFCVGRRVAARRTTLAAWLAKREAAAVGPDLT